MPYVRVTFVQSTFFLRKFVHTSIIPSVPDLSFTTFLEQEFFSFKLLCQFQFQFQLKQRLRLGSFSNKFFYPPTRAITQPTFQTGGERRLKLIISWTSRLCQDYFKKASSASTQLNFTHLKLTLSLALLSSSLFRYIMSYFIKGQ